MDCHSDGRQRQAKKKLKSDGDGKEIKQPYHYYMNVMCFQFRLLTIQYYMDECSLWELNDYIDYLPYMDRNVWESARLCAYIDAKSHFKNIKGYKDICEFKWEKEETEVEHNYEISTEDIMRLKELSKQWETE